MSIRLEETSRCDLHVYGENGEIISVRYDAVPDLVYLVAKPFQPLQFLNEEQRELITSSTYISYAQCESDAFEHSQKMMSMIPTRIWEAHLTKKSKIDPRIINDWGIEQCVTALRDRKISAQTLTYVGALRSRADITEPVHVLALNDASYVFQYRSKKRQLIVFDKSASEKFVGEILAYYDRQVAGCLLSLL